MKPARPFRGMPFFGNPASPMINRSRWACCLAVMGVLSAIGCGAIGPGSMTPPPLDSPGDLENPLFVAQPDAEIVWNQLVDVLDDHFRIRREERVRIIDDVLTEGWIETFPTTGSTWLEPWRSDSTAGYERWLATLQSIRRWARVRLIPAPGGYRVEFLVFKELENLEQPQSASVGGATLRHDTSRERDRDEPLVSGVDSRGWISLGRDRSLEQRLLSDLASRLSPTR